MLLHFGMFGPIENLATLLSAALSTQTLYFVGRCQ
jgi:hypothetical protein